MCYLGLKQFAGPDWPQRSKIPRTMRDAGVLWLQLTGGEPAAGELFPGACAAAFGLGMMMEILANGSRLSGPPILELLTTRPPHRVTLSIYGATEATYDGLTRRRGSRKAFTRGLSAARGAGIPVDLSVVITKGNAREAGAMHALVSRS
jgi:MoaA/NifB/PqqE/SkfB family radical SAM enzyme